MRRCSARCSTDFRNPFRKRRRPATSLISWLLTRIAAITVLAHLLEIAIWAGFYYWKDALPSLETSFYFSSVTYATIGYGDIVLPQPWRVLAAMEGLTGILMCGLSAAFFFAAVNRLYVIRHPVPPARLRQRVTPGNCP